MLDQGRSLGGIRLRDGSLGNLCGGSSPPQRRRRDRGPLHPVLLRGHNLSMTFRGPHGMELRDLRGKALPASQPPRLHSWCWISGAWQAGMAPPTPRAPGPNAPGCPAGIIPSPGPGPNPPAAASSIAPWAIWTSYSRRMPSPRRWPARPYSGQGRGPRRRGPSKWPMGRMPRPAAAEEGSDGFRLHPTTVRDGMDVGKIVHGLNEDTKEDYRGQVLRRTNIFLSQAASLGERPEVRIGQMGVFPTTVATWSPMKGIEVGAGAACNHSIAAKPSKESPSRYDSTLLPAYMQRPNSLMLSVKHIRCPIPLRPIRAGCGTAWRLSTIPRASTPSRG